MQEIRDPLNSNPGGAPYSDALRSGGLIFLSGQTGRDRRDGTAGQSIEEQTRQALENMQRLLRAAGASLDDVVALTVFLAKNEDRDGMNRIFSEYFREHRPTRATVVAGLGQPDALIEMQVIAVAPQ